ncbi:hypothetical protein Leryth_002038, partial [Lithospermum erythrorhizon]
LILILICQSYIVVEVKSQQEGSCSFLDIDIQRCLWEAQNSDSFDSCCDVLQQALVAGHHCFCLLLTSSGSLPLIRTPLLLLFSSCVITVPSLTTCQDPIATPHEPDISGPPILESPPARTEPPVNPEPLLIPPETPPQSSASGSSFLPLSPTRDDVPLFSNPSKNLSVNEKEPNLNGTNLPQFRNPERVSSSNSGVGVRFWFCPRLILVIVYFLCVH